MSIMIDEKILSTIGASGDSGEQVDFPSFAGELENEVESLIGTYRTSDEGYKIDLSCYETQISGNSLASWVKPLAFENNLNHAIDALATVDVLLSDYIKNQLVHVQDNFIRGFLSNQSNPSEDEDFLEQHATLFKTLNLDERKESIELRLAHSIIDLIEYTKAAKLGAKLVFDIDPEAVEYDGSQQGITKIRESLRALTIAYRKLSKIQADIIVPVSLQRGKRTHEGFEPRFNGLVSGVMGEQSWYPNNRPIEGSNLDTKKLSFRLMDYGPITRLGKHRLKRVGIQIRDKNFNSDDIKIPHYRSFKLSCETPYKLGDTDSGELEFKTLEFNNVPSTIHANQITWSGYPEVENINVDREWSLEVCDDHLFKDDSYKDIEDIILFFRLGYWQDDAD